MHKTRQAPKSLHAEQVRQGCHGVRHGESDRLVLHERCKEPSNDRGLRQAGAEEHGYVSPKHREGGEILHVNIAHERGFVLNIQPDETGVGAPVGEPIERRPEVAACVAPRRAQDDDGRRRSRRAGRVAVHGPLGYGSHQHNNKASSGCNVKGATPRALRFANVALESNPRMVQPRAVLNALSVVVLLFALAMAVPLAVSAALNDGALVPFAAGVLLTGSSGLLLRLATRGRRRELQTRDGFLIVAVLWAGLPAFAALPLLLHLDNLSLTDGYFEAVSGLTTTGATVLTGLDSLSPSINFWRAELQWIGGMGIIVLAVAILPLLGVGGSQLFRAETPGPMKDAKLTPRITETAKGLWSVYISLTAACIVAFKLAGMESLDAVIHAFTTLSLGGFSSHDASYGHWNSPSLEAVTILFMVIAGMNFATHFLAVRERSLRPYWRDPQLTPYILLLAMSVLGIALFLWVQGTYAEFAIALRYSAFNVVSIATTTGFASTDYNVWPIFAPMWMLILCSVASCAGSTGSGIKMIRAQLLLRQAFREMLHIIHPRAYLPVRIGDQIVEIRIMAGVLAFMLVYGLSVISMTMLLAASGMEIVIAFSAVIASINNTGPGLNDVGPASNFASLSDFQTWVLAFAMLLGRLELITLLVVLTPAFWRR